MVFYKGGTGSSSWNGKSMTCGFGAGIFIGRLDEGDNQRLNGIKELQNVSDESSNRFHLIYFETIHG